VYRRERPVGGHRLLSFTVVSFEANRSASASAAQRSATRSREGERERERERERANLRRRRRESREQPAVGGASHDGREDLHIGYQRQQGSECHSRFPDDSPLDKSRLASVDDVDAYYSRRGLAPRAPGGQVGPPHRRPRHHCCIRLQRQWHTPAIPKHLAIARGLSPGTPDRCGRVRRLSGSPSVARLPR